ncbi:hypothetical protein K438DRAFT_1952827 [Mycena galopus ATCC 62051]|nr:hypothetical protein K438DRAFT_1952827 [Mycena galopus ATCC 62051]
MVFPSRGSCGLCAPGVCVVFQTMTETATHCLCGHPALSHAQRGPTLPPHGGRADTGCPKFQTRTFLVDAGHTPCERPGCGVWYISHDEILPTPVQAPPPSVGPFPLPAITQLRAPPSDAMVPSRAPTANALLARQARGSQSDPSFFTTLSPDAFLHYKNHFYRQLLFGFGSQFATAPEITAFAQGFNGCITSTSDLKLGQTFGTSLKKLMPALLERRLMSPEEVLSRLVWQPSGVDELEVSEAKYETAFRRYLNGKGVVQHPLLPRDQLQDIEKEVSEDDPLARARMFPICVTGLDILPQNKGKIEMTFMPTLEGKRSAEASDEIDKGDPEKNPDGWMGHVYQKALVQVHSCFNSVDLPLDNVIGLLEQPIPDDDSICTDFDLYQYMMYRPTTRYLKFGGLVCDYPVFVPLRLILR